MFKCLITFISAVFKHFVISFEQITGKLWIGFKYAPSIER